MEPEEGYEAEWTEPAGYRFALFDPPAGTDVAARQQYISRLMLMGGIAAVGAGIVWWLVSHQRKTRAQERVAKEESASS